MKENNYQHYFGSFEKILDYISDGCCSDCFCCAWPNSIPCNFKFCGPEKEQIRDWLLSEYKDEKE